MLHYCVNRRILMNWEKQKEIIEKFCKDNNISLSDFAKVCQFIMNGFKC